jgi:hypothetical protein
MTWPTRILPFVTRAVATAIAPALAGAALESFPRFRKESSRPVLLPRAVRGFAVPPKVDR